MRKGYPVNDLFLLHIGYWSKDIILMCIDAKYVPITPFVIFSRVWKTGWD